MAGITPTLADRCCEVKFRAAEIARSARIPVVLDPNLRLKFGSPAEAARVPRDLAGPC
jgi:sugar/nucleoside kinase (ribokinase family)